MKKLYIAGHTGMVGSAILRKFTQSNEYEIIYRDLNELDLRDQAAVNKFFETEKPNVVILAAAKVGGIQANLNHPYEFLYDNLQIQNNIFNASLNNSIEKIIFLGSSCIYPKNCPQPMKEDYLLDGKLEPTNEGYALAKIAGLKLGEYLNKTKGISVLSVMPCNLYGPGDHFDPINSHVLSALVKKYFDAHENNLSKITNWGTGIARREFMHVEDLAEIIYRLFVNNINIDGFINLGWGTDVSIKELAELISNKVGYQGVTEWDATKPDGMLKKCLDVTKMKELGLEPKITLESGIEEMIKIYKNLSK